MPKGQSEGAAALALTHWQALLLAGRQHADPWSGQVDLFDFAAFPFLQQPLELRFAVEIR
ncbi:hypothetical protein ASE66_18470 [Bosea sp. Root483D1]|nr:hypothetical protein ASE66_18470 [Bosea sp. Root483D1]